MNKQIIESYIGPLKTPWLSYTLSLEHVGYLEIRTGLLFRRSTGYDLFLISNAEYADHPIQRLFGLATVTFTVNDNGEVKKVYLKNIRNAEKIVDQLHEHRAKLLTKFPNLPNSFYLMGE